MLTLSIWLTANTTYTVTWWFKGTYVNSSSCVPLSVAMLEGFFSRFWTITPYIKSETINKKAKFWYRFYYHFCKREADKLRERVVWNLTNNDPVGYLHVQRMCYRDGNFIHSVCANCYSNNSPGGGTLTWNRRGCSSEILNLTPKGDHLGVAQAFCDP